MRSVLDSLFSKVEILFFNKSIIDRGAASPLSSILCVLELHIIASSILVYFQPMTENLQIIATPLTLIWVGFLGVRFTVGERRDKITPLFKTR